MKIFWLAALFGAVQVILTALLTRMALSGKRLLWCLLVLIKSAAYVAGAMYFVYRFLGFYMYILSGCVVGFAIMALVLLFYSAILQKGVDRT